jgi:hypothetical protein
LSRKDLDLGTCRLYTSLRHARYFCSRGNFGISGTAISAVAQCGQGARAASWRGNLFSHLAFTGYPCLRLGENPLVLVGVLQEVGNVKEGITFQPDVHKRRLHARQDTTNAALVDSTHQPDIDVALVVHFNNLVVLHETNLRLMGRRRDKQLLRHQKLLSQELERIDPGESGDHILRCSSGDRAQPHAAEAPRYGPPY